MVVVVVVRVVKEAGARPGVPEEVMVVTVVVVEVCSAGWETRAGASSRTALKAPLRRVKMSWIGRFTSA